MDDEIKKEARRQFEIEKQKEEMKRNDDAKKTVLGLLIFVAIIGLVVILFN